jgi:hypothetical protein
VHQLGALLTLRRKCLVEQRIQSEERPQYHVFLTKRIRRPQIMDPASHPSPQDGALCSRGGVAAHRLGALLTLRRKCLLVEQQIQSEERPRYHVFLKRVQRHQIMDPASHPSPQDGAP